MNTILIYILYSKNINYVHNLVNGNQNVNVNEEDIQIINDKLNHHIKFFKAIEDIDDYNNIINEKINVFQKNILWVKDLEKKQLSNFNYESFMNNSRVKTYLDQFVRINYLYKIIENNQIKYAYIIRARIDQYIDYNILDKTIISLTNNIDSIYPIISSHMDNFFIVGKTHFRFFDYLINHIGTKELNYSNKNSDYLLGPELQFYSLVKTYFTNIYNFSHFNIYFEITFGIIDFKTNNVFIYRSKHTNGIYFGKYIVEKQQTIGTKMDNTNYLEFLENDKNILKLDNNIFSSNIFNIFKTHCNDNNCPITFYSIVI